MTSAPLGDVWIVGPGRIGRSLGSQIAGSGIAATVCYIARASDPQRGVHSPADPDASGWFDWSRLPDSPPSLLLITVRDESIAEVDARIAELDLSPAVALHTSGALPSSLLSGLASAGWEIGSMAPIVSIADPVADAPKLRNAWFAVEGTVGAVGAAISIVETLGGQMLRLSESSKPIYHAAAVFASNYTVTLLEIAERLLADAGVVQSDAREAVGQLAMGSVANARERGAVAALTGPIARGDVETVERHLSRLSPADRRLYSVLAIEAVRIAVDGGLAPATADRLRKILEMNTT